MLRALQACHCGCRSVCMASAVLPFRRSWVTGCSNQTLTPHLQRSSSEHRHQRQLCSATGNDVALEACKLANTPVDGSQWQHVPNLQALQEFISNATTSSALVTVLEEGASLVPQLSSQYLALACQRLAHFEDEASKAPQTQGIAPVARMLQEVATAELQGSQHFVPAHLAAMLGALASLGVRGPATEAFVSEAAQFSQNGAQRFDISHHVTLMNAFARLTPRGRSATEEVQRYMRDVSFLLRFQEDNDHGFVQDGLQSSDFPGISWALGRTLASQGAIDEWEGRGRGRAGPPLSSAPQHVHGASALMHTLAYRAKYHLASRHSGRPAYSPTELAQLVCGFALLGDCSSEVGGLLDAVAGNIVRRVKARHLNAVSQLDLSAQLLWAFAELQHVTVATPELLNALGGEVARRLAPDEYTAGRSPGSRKALDAEVGQQSLPEHCDTLRDIVTVLWAHQQLGFCPCQQLLAAVSPAIVRGASGLTENSAEMVFSLFECFDNDPGPMVTDLLLSFQSEQPQLG